MAHTHKVILAAFDETNEADAAFHELTDGALVNKDHVTVITQKPEEVGDVAHDDDDDPSIGGGIAKGATLGALAGFLISAATLVLPGIGTLVAIGPVAAMLGLTGVAATTVTGATTGAVAGGLISALGKIGLSKEEAEPYERAVKGGGVFMAVPVMNNENELRRVFEDHGADHIRVMDIDSDEELFV